jgi:hypothetical protein
MKCLSVKQPFAWLIVNRFTPVENRQWPTWYLGPLLIHASKTYDQAGHDWVREKFPKIEIPALLPNGAIVGRVEMIGCVNQHYSQWFVGPWGFVFDLDFNLPVAFNAPVAWRGQLGLFEVPASAIEGR